MDTRWKNIITSIFSISMVANGVWQMFSSQPFVVGVLAMLGVNSSTTFLDFVSRYWSMFFGAAILLMLWGPPLWRRLRGLKVIIGKRFVDTVVIVDGHYYLNCTFENCRMRWNGGPWRYENLKCINTPFETQNIAIVDTVNILKSFGWLEKNFAKGWQIKPKEYFKGDFVDAPKQEHPKIKTVQKAQKRRSH